MTTAEITMPSPIAAPPPGQHQSSSSSSKVNKEFAKSLKGILRVVEVVVALIAFICATVGRNNVDLTPPLPKLPALEGGAGWCMFVSMFNCLLYLTSYFLWLFNVMLKLTPDIPVRFIEFISMLVFAGFYLISGIVSASFGSDSKGLAAAAFFNFAMMCLCSFDGYLHYREWAGSDEGPYSCCGQAPQPASSPAVGRAQSYPATGHEQSPSRATSYETSPDTTQPSQPS